MKKLYTMVMTLVLFALVIVPMAASAQATGTDEVIATDTKVNMIYGLVVMAVPIIASFVANFTEKKPTDSAWVRFCKNVVNLFALNFSAKSGK